MEFILDFTSEQQCPISGGRSLLNNLVTELMNLKLEGEFACKRKEEEHGKRQPIWGILIKCG